MVGLSILSGSHLRSCPRRCACCATRGVDAPVVVGGIIPDADRRKLLDEGVAHVFTPKDYKLAEIMSDIADLAIEHRRKSADAAQTQNVGLARIEVSAGRAPRSRPRTWRRCRDASASSWA